MLWPSGPGAHDAHTPPDHDRPHRRQWQNIGKAHECTFRKSSYIVNQKKKGIGITLSPLLVDLFM